MAQAKHTTACFSGPIKGTAVAANGNASYSSSCQAAAASTQEEAMPGPLATAMAAVEPFDPATLLSVHVPPLPESCSLGARVEHLSPRREGRLTDVVVEALGLPRWFVMELVDFGAIYHCPVHPPPPGNAPGLLPGMRQRMEEMRALALQQHGADTRLSHPRRVKKEDVGGGGRGEGLLVGPGSYVRVHLHPKRFPAYYTTDWKARILHDGPDYVVINKPPGVQVAPRVDNGRECCLTAVAQALGLQRPLLITHRLDCFTEGVLVLGKTKSFVQRFNALLQGKKAPPPPSAALAVGGGGGKRGMKSRKSMAKARRKGASSCAGMEPPVVVRTADSSQGDDKADSYQCDDASPSLMTSAAPATEGAAGARAFNDSLSNLTAGAVPTIGQVTAAVPATGGVAGGPAVSAAEGAAGGGDGGPQAAEPVVTTDGPPAVGDSIGTGGATGGSCDGGGGGSAPRVGGSTPRSVEKYYRALSRGPVPLGVMVHWAEVNTKLKGLPAFTAIDNTSGQGPASSSPPSSRPTPSPPPASPPRQQQAQSEALPGAPPPPPGAPPSLAGAPASFMSAPLSPPGAPPPPADGTLEPGTAAAGNADTRRDVGSGGGSRCELHVLSCRRVGLSSGAAERWGLTEAWESEVLLVTGRTHQIRAQLAAVGQPLLGDPLYGALAAAAAAAATGQETAPPAAMGQETAPTAALGQGCWGQPAAVEAVVAQQQQGGGSSDLPHGQAGVGSTREQEEGGRAELAAAAAAGGAGAPRALDEPDAPLGLQACRLVVRGDSCMGPPPVEFAAAAPWWRADELGHVE